MSAATLITSIALLFLGFSFLYDLPLHVYSNDAGFSANLIHCDSPESPFHNPNSTLFSRNLASIHRSAAHKNRHTIEQNPNVDYSISSILLKSDFDYIMLIEIGTPPRIIHFMVDSGSNLMWMQCSPCKRCYRHQGSIFKPKASSTYKIHPCHSDECSTIEHTPCRGRKPRCEYSFAYVDDSTVKGILSSETLTFDIAPGTGRGRFHVPGIVFGCTHETEGNFNSHSTGLVGLGPGRPSLTRQLGFHGGTKFSYCLPSTPNKATRIYFGLAAVVSGPNVMSTPMHVTNNILSLYEIRLQRIHVTNGFRTTIIELRSPRNPHGDLIVIDSGASMTSINPSVMSSLSHTLEIFLPNQRVAVPIEVAHTVDLCFHSQVSDNIPLIKFEFEGDAIVVLPRTNVFLSLNPTTICLTIASSVHFDGQSTFGSQAQWNHRIGYDLDARRINFLPVNC